MGWFACGLRNAGTRGDRGNFWGGKNIDLEGSSVPTGPPDETSSDELGDQRGASGPREPNDGGSLYLLAYCLLQQKHDPEPARRHCARPEVLAVLAVLAGAKGFFEGSDNEVGARVAALLSPMQREQRSMTVAKSSQPE